MHFDSSPSAPAPDGDRTPWYKLLNRYHWFVLVVAVLGWSFDTMDQQLFNLAREPAMRELLSEPIKGSDGVTDRTEANAEAVAWFGPLTTSIFLIGWATGGFFFGILGDKIGRAKTMMLTILVYSLCTGLSALSVGVWDFALYRFLTGLGVGGEFAVGVALVAEAMPERARTPALGWVQAFSAIGNITAAFISQGLGAIQQGGHSLFGLSSWRVMFLVGSLPALLAVVIRARLREPERWKSAALAADVDPNHPVRDLVADEPEAAKAAPAYRLGSLAELFGDPILRRNTIVGMLLAFAGVVGLWGIGFFSFDLIRRTFRQILQAQGHQGADLDG
jgi:MFS family permease